MAVVIRSVDYVSQVQTRASLGLADVPVVADQTVTRQGHDTAARLTPTSTVPATKDAYTEVQLSGGAASIDLTAMPGGETGVADLSGLKVQILKVKAVDATGANTPHAVTAKVGASNGYLAGGTSWQFAVGPGGEFVAYLADASPDVDGAHKSIDFTGTGTDKFLVCVIAG